MRSATAKPWAGQLYTYDVMVLGAGGAGLFAAAIAGGRGRRVLVLEHGVAPGEKIRISGGGRCNFTNLNAGPQHFLSANPPFCHSALAGFGPRDFVAMVERHGIAYHEKSLGQLFCDGSAQQIIDMLMAECRAVGVEIRLSTSIRSVAYSSDRFVVDTSGGRVEAKSLIVATGGLSIPKIGATGLGYEIAHQFGLGIVPTRPALVPLTFDGELLRRVNALSGLSVNAVVAHAKTKFREGLLFTHRGLSGPSILQISSYWRDGDEIGVNLAPDIDAFAVLKSAKQQSPRVQIHTALAEYLPQRLAQMIVDLAGGDQRIADAPDRKLRAIADAVKAWRIVPVATEGYRTAEVTLGGVDTKDLSSKTMEARTVPGLLFVGEVVDVTGHLGGYNFQWAWSSAHAAGKAA